MAPSASTTVAPDFAKRDRAALAGDERPWAEALGVEPLGDAAAPSAPPARRAGRPGRRPRWSRSARSGTSVGRSRGVEHAVRCRCAARPAGSGRRRPASRSSRTEDDRSSARRGRRESQRLREPDDAVGDGVVAQHAHDRGDAGARGDEQQPCPAAARAARSRRPPGRAGPRAGPGRCTRWLLTLPSGIALTVIADAAVGAVGRGQRVGPPLADAVDVDADADVLAGRVPGQPRPGRITSVAASRGLGTDRLDPAAQVGAGAQRVDRSR